MKAVEQEHWARIQELPLEACRESLQHASLEAIREIARILTEDQAHYLQQTLPPQKANILKQARLAIFPR